MKLCVERERCVETVSEENEKEREKRRKVCIRREVEKVCDREKVREGKRR